MNSVTSPQLSVVIVSFNTSDMLRQCLQTLEDTIADISHETIVVDNASRDDSADMVDREFPEVHLVRSDINLGFAAANNRAFPEAKGRYLVLLNSDAFPNADALRLSLERMEADPGVGLGGARLVGTDGSWQPSARLFPSPLNELLALSGLAARFPKSRFFGRLDRTWADPDQPAQVDWVPGAYSIIRREALEKAGNFDECFFLYFEEVDLCRRIRSAGYRIEYWPDVVVTHLGGESSKTLAEMDFSSAGSQLTLWRMRSQLLYYRKHHGELGVWLSWGVETVWHTMRMLRNRLLATEASERKARESKLQVQLMAQAWRNTDGGRVSPLRPW